jgi:hypothetical protein
MIGRFFDLIQRNLSGAGDMPLLVLAFFMLESHFAYPAISHFLSFDHTDEKTSDHYKTKNKGVNYLSHRLYFKK